MYYRYDMVKRKAMKLFKWFKVNGEDREFMYLYGADSKQEILDFLNEFQQHYNGGDLYRIAHNKKADCFRLWDARA